ncbi:MAG: glycosyltransferase family 4 protein [Deltaproteobacteria bacterium]|nr:glycosyltransferase family 4 protein [Deltaproteobacteria bacterium]
MTFFLVTFFLATFFLATFFVAFGAAGFFFRVAIPKPPVIALGPVTSGGLSLRDAEINSLEYDLAFLREPSAATLGADVCDGALERLLEYFEVAPICSLRDEALVARARRAPRPLVLHTSVPRAWQALHVRDLAHNPPTTIVTATAHSVGYLDQRIPLLKALLLFREPPDLVLCPSMCAEVALRRDVAAISSVLGPRACDLNERLHTMVVPHGVDEERFRPRSAPDVRRVLDVAADEVLVLCFTRLSPWNKMELMPLLVAARAALADGARFTLCVAGEEQAPGYRARLRRFAGELGVASATRFPTERIPAEDLHAAADVFVSPTDNVQETFGLTLLEAMACGAAVIASAWDGYREIIDDGRTGLLVPTAGPYPSREVEEAELFVGAAATLGHAAQTTIVDVGALAERLKRVASDATLRRKLGEAARAEVLARFSARGWVARYDEMWRDLLERRRRVLDDPPAGHFYVRDYAAVFEGFASGVVPSEGVASAFGREAALGGAAFEATLRDTAMAAGIDLDTILAAIRLGSLERLEAPERAFAHKYGLAAAARDPD